MEGHLHRPQHQQPHHHQPSLNVDPSSSTGPDRLPQWSVQETKELLVTRADLNQSFIETKRNKLLWEVISTKMKDKGYSRSSEQCRCKWKNLVTRYKGCEAIEAEAMRQQFPFFNDMQAIFGARERIQKMLWAEAEGGASSNSRNKLTPTPMAFFSEGEEEEDDSEEERGRKKKKTKNGGGGIMINSGSSGELWRLLEDFMKQQLQLETQWREAFEARESERRAKELEWRQMMEALEKERIMMDQSWREREEQRWAREDARAEKRAALISALLNELRKSEHDSI